ncbi:hypothetical protein BH09VER1_BH09VER1_42910 [soil metagenome]
MPFRWLRADKEQRLARGFTLLEILAATALLIIILTLTGSIISSSSRVWRQANAKIESYQTARAAFDVMTAKLAKATLNTYWDYYDASGAPYRLSSSPATFVPAVYGRYSDLHFICGPASTLITTLPSDLSATATQAVFFAAPTGLSTQSSYNGLPGLLAACGYFVAFGSENSHRPAFLPPSARFRWRLMELIAPVEELQVFASSTGTSWFATEVTQGRARSVAENVIALVVWPRRSTQDDPAGTALAPNYAYDSRTTESWSGSPPKQPVQSYQLPPNLQISMVIIDEAAAARLEAGSTPPEAINSALAGLFSGSVSEYESDMKKLQDRLSAKGIGYRIFSTTVALRESKWSP